ncbi:MAG TPA: HEAT repeat domain-containing protein, partial [Patescibacteria group bacterium]|nr:HEAT repeat domain-containing protein [Patescibacteria group bacterium]
DLNCEGTREQLLDYCLFRWHAEQSNVLHTIALKKVVQKVTGSEPCSDFKTQFKTRLQSGGFTNANDWMLHCLAGHSPELQVQALQAAMQTKDEPLIKAACELLLDTNARTDVRAEAIKLAARSATRESLLALCDLLNDSTPAYRREYLPMLQTDYPFADYASVEAGRQELAKWFKKSPEASKTLGQLARKELKTIARRDLGDKPQKWRTWVEEQKKETVHR